MSAVAGVERPRAANRHGGIADQAGQVVALDLVGSGRDARRNQLRLLDSCLGCLENDQENGEKTVSVQLARRFERAVGGLTEGMSIADALEVVFAAQGHVMHANPDSHLAAPRQGLASAPGLHLSTYGETVSTRSNDACVQFGVGQAQPLLPEEARALTDRIKTARHQVSVFLVEAHERKAWSVLGYRSWGAYVRVEFRLSHSRSYELLDHGRILLDLMSAARLSGIPDISPYAAAQIKPRLVELTAEIRERSDRLTEAQAHQLVTNLVRSARFPRSEEPPVEMAVSRRARASEGATLSPIRLVDPAALISAINHLAGLPPAAIVAASLTASDVSALRAIPRVTKWLAELGALFVSEPYRAADQVAAGREIDLVAV
jgi:hypothetical protein